MKNIFYILIEHVDDTIFESMYYFAISSPKRWTLMFGGSKRTMFFDSEIALRNILERGGFS